MTISYFHINRNNWFKRFKANKDVIAQTNIYFKGFGKTYFFERNSKIGKTLDKMYRAKRSLRIKVKIIFCEKFVL